MVNFRHVSAGESSKRSPARSASWLNAVSRAAEAHQRSLERGDAGNRVSEEPAATHHLRVKNNTGDDLPRGAVIQLRDYRLWKNDLGEELPVKPRLKWFDGSKYSEEESGPLVYLNAPIAHQSQGAAVVGGVIPVRVDIKETDHKFCQPVDGLTWLESTDDEEGFPILTPREDYGVQEVLVLVGMGRPAGGSNVQLAIIKGVVPAAEINDSSLGGIIGEGDNLCTPGKLERVWSDITFTEGALLINTDGTPQMTGEGAEASIRVLNVLNTSLTPWGGDGRFSNGENPPIISAGMVKGDDFILFNQDPRHGPGYKKGADSSSQFDDPDVQIFFHGGGRADFEYSATVCSPLEGQ